MMEIRPVFYEFVGRDTGAFVRSMCSRIGNISKSIEGVPSSFLQKYRGMDNGIGRLEE